MHLPFTPAQFFAVFAAYNTAVWPAQLGLAAVALLIVVALARASGKRSLLAALSGLWLWMGVVYHWHFFATINPAARAFAVLFIAGSAGFAWSSLFPRNLDAPVLGIRRILGWAAVLYALAGYPLVAHWAGQRYPALPTFGLPCPTTIFTLGALLLLSARTPLLLFVVPLLWSAIATLAATHLNVVEDYGLGVTAILTIPVLAVRRRAP